MTLIAAAVVALMAAPAASAQEGAKPAAAPPAFNNACRTCHSTKEGDNRIGPSLYKIFGSKAGSRPGYPNSSAAMKNSGIVWNEQTLNRFIESPDSVVPNNAMKPYGGLTDEAARQSIIDYLKSAS